MKIKEIISNLDKSENNRDENITWDLECMFSELDVPHYSMECQDSSNPLLKAYWIANHYCTDSYVGYRAYFFKDKFVCASYQAGRKSDEVFYWKDETSSKIVKGYLISLLSEQENEPEVTLIDLEEDMGDGYPISFANEFIGTHAIFKGKLMKYLHRANKDYLCKEVILEDSNGNQVSAHVDHILLPWHTDKEENNK